jgi:hypothetical protein
MRYADLDLSADLHGVPVLYTSSEDRGLQYKSWIEDLVLAMEAAGARTIPSFRFLRAHHNKVMMEALRTQLFPKEAALLHTYSFGTYRISRREQRFEPQRTDACRPGAQLVAEPRRNSSRIWPAPAAASPSPSTIHPSAEVHRSGPYLRDGR